MRKQNANYYCSFFSATQCNQKSIKPILIDLITTFYCLLFQHLDLTLELTRYFFLFFFIKIEQLNYSQ